MDARNKSGQGGTESRFFPRLCLLPLACLPLAACGFTPLYATPGMTPALASVQVTTPQSRTGYLLKQALSEELASDTETPPHYLLNISTAEVRYPRGVRVNNVASRYEIALTADYSLSDAATGKVVYQGHAPVVVSYDAANPPYSGVAASQEGEQRAADQAAIRIRLDLSRYFERLATAP